MPRGRKAKATAPPASHAQSTLSFNNKSARITKPNTRQDDATKKAAAKLSDPEPARIDDEVTTNQTSDSEDETEVAAADVPPEPDTRQVDIAIRESPAKPLKAKVKTEKRIEAAKDERELAAEKVTDAQLKQYWKAEEDSRLAPRGKLLQA